MLDFLISLFDEKNPIEFRHNKAILKYQIESAENLVFLKQLDFNEVKNESGIVFSDQLLVGEEYLFDVSVTSLREFGFYLSKEDFINNNKLSCKEDFYIFELKCRKNYGSIFIINYLNILSVAEFIKEISDVTTSTGDNIIFSEENYLKLIVNYDVNLVSTEKQILTDKQLEEFNKDFENGTREIKSIFRNELIDFLKDQPENLRFTYLISNFDLYCKKCFTSYEYYISDFKYNKIKNELDTSVLEFSKNIRSVINDSQGKLIVIPATIVLAFSTFDLNNPFNGKNFVIFISSMVFAYLMHIFIENQKTALDIIKTNIDNYKNIFESKNEIELTNIKTMVKNVFEKNEEELKKQKTMLFHIGIINWLIPVGLFLVLLYLVYQIHR